MSADPSRPPRIGSSSEIFLGVALVGFVAALVFFDLAGALTNWLGGGVFSLLGPNETTRFVAHALTHADRVGDVWPRRTAHVFPAALFWVTLGILVTASTAGVVALWRRLHKRGRASREEGFASRPALERVASFDAARARLPQTRPSLDAELAQRSDVGYPLGRSRRPGGIDLVASWESSLQLVAPTAAGKTLRVLTRIARQHPGPVIATSTKPDLYEVSAPARAGIGPVVVLDPELLAPSADPVRWSPVMGCADTRVAERRAAALIAANGETSDVRSGAFFRQSAVAVLTSYLHAAALSGGSMADVTRWASRPSDPAPLRILAEEGSDAAGWGARLSEHTSGAIETTSGVMRTVDLALGCFRHREVLDLCSPPDGEDFDFDAFFADRGTVYALGKDRRVGSIGVGPLITAFVEELVIHAELTAARQPGRRLDPPLLALLDEAPAIAPLPGLPALVADGRGRGITVIYAMQSFSQAIERWGRNGAATMRNAATITAVFGGLSVREDLEELSLLCGTRKVIRHSTNEDWRRSGHSFGATWVDEPVLTAGDIHALPEGVALVLWGALPPALAYQPGTWEGEDAAIIAADEATTRQANDAARAQAER
jgi:type IV secretion system protein VirD4